MSTNCIHCGRKDARVPPSLMCPQCEDDVTRMNQLIEERDRLHALNEDKFRTIQAYCKAASEDKAEVERLRSALADLLKSIGPCSCLEDYTKRGRPDPMCQYHDNYYEIEAARKLLEAKP